ncbi:MAG: GIY-YIG nuclease family protein [candidate division FCPU426 bacterium]
MKAAAPKKKPWWVYVLECEDGSLYTGISVDPGRRFEQHRKGKGAAYTRSHKPVRMLSKEKMAGHAEALRRELQVKRRAKNEKLAYAAKPKSLKPPRKRNSGGGR